MSKIKEKKIKKLKKNRIWTSVLLMFITFGCLAVIITVFIYMITMVSIYTKIDNSYDDTKNMTKILKQCYEKKQDVKSTLEGFSELMEKDQSVCILDNNDQFVEVVGNSKPDLHNMVKIQDDYSYEIYPDKTVGCNWDLSDGRIDINFTKSVGDTLHSFILKGKYDEVWMNGTAASADYWIKEKIPHTNYSILVKSSLHIKRKELLYLGGIVIGTIVLLAIPFILLFINLIGNFRTQKRVRKMLYLDLVTGGHNWLYFKNQAVHILKKRKNQSKQFAMLSLQMRKYRSYCGYYGSKAGEDLLETFDRILKLECRKQETFARNGKADFGILMSYDDKDQLIARIRGLISKLSAVQQERKIEFHVGIYEITNLKQEIDEMYNYAGGARAELGTQSQRVISFYDNSILESQLWERTVEDTMEDGLMNHEFQVYLQPKYSTSDESLSGAEALVRWLSKDKGLIPPNKFIPIFEKNGFIIRLDDYMLAEVAKQQAKWLAEGKKLIPISVNVSRAHFSREDLAEHIREIIDTYHVPHDVIELELTESAFFDDKDILLDTVKKLKEYGFLISMDDFGAGYSSLNSLKDLPLDVLKLDAEFFRGDMDNKRGKIIVQEAIHLAKNLQMKIVAEGIETKEQVEFLASHGCDLIQGFYYARPMPLEDFEKEAFSSKY